MRSPLSIGIGVVLLGCWASVATAQDALVLVGSGSTVPAPLLSKWGEAYNQNNRNTQLRYLANGTLEGITAISRGSGDFAAGEIPLSAKQRSDGGLIEVPAVVIGIAPIYNLPGVQKELRFSGEVLADIFLGDIKSWNAPALAKLNPGVTLPNMPIKVVNRPAGKGSNYIFTEYLAKASPKFRREIGVSASPTWPVGKHAERSSEMVDAVRTEPGTIGYVEAQYAIQSGVSMGLVQNASGNFVKATPKNLAAACHSVEAPAFDNLSASLTNAPGADSFPITSFDWLYLRTKTSDAKRAAAMQEFLGWVLSDGQRVAGDAGYSELPSPLLKKVSARIATLK